MADENEYGIPDLPESLRDLAMAGASHIARQRRTEEAGGEPTYMIGVVDAMAGAKYFTAKHRNQAVPAGHVQFMVVTIPASEDETKTLDGVLCYMANQDFHDLPDKPRVGTVVTIVARKALSTPVADEANVDGYVVDFIRVFDMEKVAAGEETIPPGMQDVVDLVLARSGKRQEKREMKRRLAPEHNRVLSIIAGNPEGLTDEEILDEAMRLLDEKSAAKRKKSIEKHVDAIALVRALGQAEIERGQRDGRDVELLKPKAKDKAQKPVAA